MWEQPAVQENVQVLAARGVEIVGPDEGRLAGGDIGAGRLAEPEVIVAAVERVLTGGGHDLEGRTVLVTAGGTREPICPVRYLGNRSSGKQGHALAAEAAARGAKVLCVSTVPERAPRAPGIEVIAVETAAEMATAVGQLAPGADYVFMAAAVADFRPVDVAGQKIKKADGPPEIRLEPTTDILAELGRTRTPGQVIVGFAAETSDLRQNAAAKLAAKGADLIVANDVSAPDTGFEHDTNAVLLLDAEGGEAMVPLTGKRQIARAVLDAAIDIRHRRRAGNGVDS
jgi:phosphopantothenoylcysteine decarboxylase/phosphopantothenate--cysteine ligase